MGVGGANSSRCTPPTNAAHSAGGNTSAGPVGCRELRTAPPPSPSSAPSTQFPRFPLRELLRQTAPVIDSAEQPFRTSPAMLISPVVAPTSGRHVSTSQMHMHMQTTAYSGVEPAGEVIILGP